MKEKKNDRIITKSYLQNAFFVTEDPIATCVSKEQKPNAEPQISVTDDGIVIWTFDEHSSKVFSSILVKDDESSTSTNDSLFSKEYLPISVIEEGIWILTRSDD